MRIAHIHDPLIGVIADVYLPAAQEQTWQRARLSAFRSACTSAAAHQAACILLSGRLFGEGYVTHAVIAEVLGTIRQTDCPVLWRPDAAGEKYLTHQEDLPENLVLLSPQQPFALAEDLRIACGSAAKQAESGCTILIAEDEEPIGADTLRRLFRADADLQYIVAGETCHPREGSAFASCRANKLENAGFDDPDASGYHLLDFDGGRLVSRVFIGMSNYRFRTIPVHVENADDPKAVLHRCMKATVGLTDHDFVRLILGGSVDVETFIDPDAIREQLKNRFFCLEVFDECQLMLDEEAYAADISLKSEFIRMVMADDTLSANEKSRIIQCGWNALRGKELSE